MAMLCMHKWFRKINTPYVKALAEAGAFCYNQGMKPKKRRLGVVIAAFVGVVMWLVVNPESYESVFVQVENTGAESGIFYDGGNEVADEGESGNGITGGEVGDGVLLASEVLERLEVKGRAPKTGYKREEFYNGWPTVDGCNLRQRIIKREFGETAVLDECTVVAGEFVELYTGKTMKFSEKAEISKNIQIDHVVALSDAWQKGAQYMTASERYEIATDPLNLLAVEAAANSQKSDGDAATWLPSNKIFRCQYVARQVSVKYKYGLWVTAAEKEAIAGVLEKCPTEPAVGV